jgi:hypothetical protein
MIPLASQLLNSVLFDRDSNIYEANLNTAQLSVVLYLVRMHNAGCRLSLSAVQVNFILFRKYLD